MDTGGLCSIAMHVQVVNEKFLLGRLIKGTLKVEFGIEGQRNEPRRLAKESLCVIFWGVGVEKKAKEGRLNNLFHIWEQLVPRNGPNRKGEELYCYEPGVRQHYKLGVC